MLKATPKAAPVPQCTSASTCVGRPGAVMMQHWFNGRRGDLNCVDCLIVFKAQTPRWSFTCTEVTTGSAPSSSDAPQTPCYFVARYTNDSGQVYLRSRAEQLWLEDLAQEESSDQSADEADASNLSLIHI